MRERDREALRNGELSPTELDDPYEFVDEYDSLRAENTRLAEELALAGREIADLKDEISELRAELDQIIVG